MGWVWTNCRARSISRMPVTSRKRGDWSDFTLNHDAAPNDRFNDLARLIGEGDVRCRKAATVARRCQVGEILQGK